MRINLLADYRGVLTNERFFVAGEYDLDGDIAAALVNAGRAEYIDAPKPEQKPKTSTTKRAKR